MSLGGGGTDLPSYYKKWGGFVLSAGIDSYIYVSIQRAFKDFFSLKYSKLEDVKTVDEIEHPAIREALKYMHHTEPINLTNLQDIPAGTGLGSSGAFTVALLQALHTLKGTMVSRLELAEQAYHVERDILGQPVGKQDQYISAVGGVTCFGFLRDDSVHVEPLNISSETLKDLEDNLLLFFTGYSRSASEILQDQDVKSARNDAQMIENLHCIRELGFETKDALEDGDLRGFAALMDKHWIIKKERSGMSNSDINDLYELGKMNGALGGKLVGAGGGGFLMFYAEDKEQLRAAMSLANLKEVKFKFDHDGVKVKIIKIHDIFRSIFK